MSRRSVRIQMQQLRPRVSEELCSSLCRKVFESDAVELVDDDENPMLKSCKSKSEWPSSLALLPYPAYFLSVAYLLVVLFFPHCAGGEGWASHVEPSEVSLIDFVRRIETDSQVVRFTTKHVCST